MNVETFHRRLKELYLPPQRRFTLVNVPEIRYAVIDGKGDPESAECAEAVKWLYSVIHLLKPLVRQRMGNNFVEPPLECLCWAEREKDFREGNRHHWQWRVMVVLIDWITREQFAQAVAKVEAKRGPAPPTLRLETLREGRCVQIMHVGDYKELGALCEKLYHEYLPAHHLKPKGRYHEIYLNDPARTAPGKRRVVIRQPVASCRRERCK